MRRLPLLALLVCLAGCGGDERVTIYLPQHLGPEGPHYQRVPVLSPVERERSGRISAARQVMLELTVGPAPEERARGFVDTIPLSTRVLGVRVAGDTATVELVGAEPDYLGSAAIVYSLTELAGIARVRLLLDGEPCCLYTHRSTPWPGAIERRTYRGWTGEPCASRIEDRCRGN
jgi:Sporulation and spore germination